jgi:hypothetical protein
MVEWKIQKLSEKEVMSWIKARIDQAVKQEKLEKKREKEEAKAMRMCRKKKQEEGKRDAKRAK